MALLSVLSPSMQFQRTVLSVNHSIYKHDGHCICLCFLECQHGDLCVSINNPPTTILFFILTNNMIGSLVAQPGPELPMWSRLALNP